MTDEGLYAVIGGRIREERERHEMKLEQLADELGIDASHLSRMERGERGIDTVMLRRIARLFGLSTDAFFEASGAVGTATYARRGDADDDAMTEMIEWGRRLHANMGFVEREFAQIDG